MTTMKDVRRAIEAAAAALRDAGYVFVEPDRACTRPPADRLATLDALEKRAGRLPASVRAFYEAIGGVDFRGTHPDWPRTGSVELAPEPFWLTDPLVVVRLEVALEDPLVEAWSAGDAEPLVVRIVPEPLTKAGFSAGIGYGVACVSSGGPVESDAILEGNPTNETFVEHLHHALEWGGLPGFASIDERPHDLLNFVRMRILASASST